MKRTALVFTTLATTSLILAGCSKPHPILPQAPASSKPAPVAAAAARAKGPNDVVASVNGAQYLRKELDPAVESRLKAQNVPEAQKEQARVYFEQAFINNFIEHALLMDAAKAEKIAVSDADRKEQLEKLTQSLKAKNKTLADLFKESPLGEDGTRRQLEENLCINKLLQAKVLCAIKIEDAEVQALLDKIQKANAEKAEKNKAIAAANAAKKAKILALKKQLEAGADFAELAKSNSDCPSKERGGDLGEFSRGQMVKPFEEAAFSQAVGKVGDVVETTFGYHLIKVTAKTPATKASGDQPAKPETVAASHILIATEPAQKLQPLPTKEQVLGHLKQQKSREAVAKYIGDLKKAAKIQSIYPETAPTP